MANKVAFGAHGVLEIPGIETQDHGVRMGLFYYDICHETGYEL
jgi:hypothetical protein